MKDILSKKEKIIDRMTGGIPNRMRKNMQFIFLFLPVLKF